MSALQHTSFTHAVPLSEDELRRYAPSVFATSAHRSRSERFVPIPTIEALRGLAKEGFSIVDARQSRSRDPDRGPFTKHLLRLRRLEKAKIYQRGSTIFEIGLKNGNDGSCAWDIFAGLFEILCLNGMIAPVGQTESLKVRHTGDAVHKVIDGSFEVLKQAERALEAPRMWGAINLDTDERLAFAEAAHKLRFANPAGEVKTAITPTQLLNPRREPDVGTNLWKTFNVVQENVIRGGLMAEGLDANMRRRMFRSRAIRGVDQDVRLNRALFVLADKVAVHKGAPALTQMALAA